MRSPTTAASRKSVAYPRTAYIRVPAGMNAAPASSPYGQPRTSSPIEQPMVANSMPRSARVSGRPGSSGHRM